MTTATVARSGDTFRIERQTRINASPEAVYPFIEDFHRWTVWSPWEKLDADLSREYSGAAKGVGARYAWAGKKAGAGSMEINSASAPGRIGIRLDFLKPMKATNAVTFTIMPEGNGSRVTWVMEGTRPFFMKLMGMIFNMDKMVGGDFEKGLAALKAAAEA